MSEQESKLYALYQAVHLMMAKLGADGEIDTRAPEVDAVMDAMHEYDGGQYIQWNTPQPVTPAGGEVEARAKAMFEAGTVGANSAPWEQQWEPTKEYWRAKAAHPPVADAALVAIDDAMVDRAVKAGSDAFYTIPAETSHEETMRIAERAALIAALNQRGGG